MIGSASPGNSVAPPTATVQPTVVSSTSSSSSLSFNRGVAGLEPQRRDEFVHHVKERESPMKASSTTFFHHHQQQQQQTQQPTFVPHPNFPAGFSYAAPYAAYPYPTSADIYRAAVPPPAHVVPAGMPGTPFYAGQFAAGPAHPAPPPMPYAYPPDYRPAYSSMYQQTSAPTTFPPQASYFLAPTSATEMPSSAPIPTSSAAAATQLALPTPPHLPAAAAYYYSGYSYPYSAGRIIAPVLALGVLPFSFLFFSFIF